MDLNKQTVKALLGVACGSIAFAAALLHLSTAAGAVVWLLGVLAPPLPGRAIAFILNGPMRGLERYLLPHAKKTEKLRRPLALVLTIAAVAAGLALAAMGIVPGVEEAGKSIAAPAPQGLSRVKERAVPVSE